MRVHHPNSACGIAGRGKAAAICVLIFSGCLEKPGFVGRLCDEAEPCPDGLVCRDTVCMEPCAIDGECSGDQMHCVNGACEPLSALCISDDECDRPGACEIREGARCRGGVCNYLPRQCLAPPPSECVDNDSAFKS